MPLTIRDITEIVHGRAPLPRPVTLLTSCVSRVLGTRPVTGRSASGVCRASAGSAPDVRAAVRDVLLRAETAVIEARVPRHATLDSLLRQHQLSTDLVNAAVQSAAAVFNPRRLRADRPYRLVLSFDGFLREFEYEIDTDQFLRIISRDRGRPEVLDAEVLPFEKESNVLAIRGDIDARHSSLIAAMGETGENIQLAMALADIFGGQIDFNSDLQPGRSLRAAVREVDPRRAVRRLRQHPRRDVRGRRQGASGGALDQSRDRQGRLLRRGGPVAEAVLPGVAAQVRAARHLELLAPAAASGAPHRARASRRRLRGAARRRGASRSPAGRSSRRAGPVPAATRSASATTAASRPTICTCRLSRRASAPARASIRVRSSAGSARPAPRPGRIWTSAAQERRVRRSRRRAPPPASRRADPRAFRAAFLASRDAMLQQIARALPAAAAAPPDAVRAERIADPSSLIANP